MKTLEQSDLTQFTGTDNYYRHLFGRLIYTDGVRHVAETAGAYWLLDAIASYQPMLKQHKDERLHDLQFWKLVVNEDHSAVLTCAADAGVKPAVKQEIPMTDFPLKEIEIWVGRDEMGMVAYLPSEH